MARLERSPVQVTWHDAHSLDNNEWHDLADIDDVPLVCVSIGILIRHKRHCVLIQTSTADQGADNVLLIPMGYGAENREAANPPQETQTSLR